MRQTNQSVVIKGATGLLNPIHSICFIYIQ